MMTSESILSRLSPQDVKLEIKDPVDATALLQAKEIIKEVLLSSSSSSNDSGCAVSSSKLLEVAKRLGDVPTEATSFVISEAECKAAFETLTERERLALVRIHERIERFAKMQRSSVQDMTMAIPGGRAGHSVSPCAAAGCYAPGGRYPLPSSVLMTAVTARAAGCARVVVSSPRPAPITLAAAHVAGAHIVLCLGGAQAIAAMAYGVVDDDVQGETGQTAFIVPPCDVICGPGNKWVTAAKSIVGAGRCGIDMLAGPSEVLVICDALADPAIVAADLIAQAEHDIVARAILLCTDAAMIDRIDQQVRAQVHTLPEPNQSTALQALRQSFAVHCSDIAECVRLSDAIAPEHLEIQTSAQDTLAPQVVADMCQHYGGLFIGLQAAEVLGDYGAGPNHTLPTGGTGRYTGGLSVFNFLRIRTWMTIDHADDPHCQQMLSDTIVMARLEGLEGHARAAELRNPQLTHETN